MQCSQVFMGSEICKKETKRLPMETKVLPKETWEHWQRVGYTLLDIFETYLGLPSYAILSQLELPKSRKWQKILIFALFCTINAHYAYLINYAWTMTSTTCSETFRTIIICNMELIRATKVEKKANVHMCTNHAHGAWTRSMHEL